MINKYYVFYNYISIYIKKLYRKIKIIYVLKIQQLLITIVN